MNETQFKILADKIDLLIRINAAKVIEDKEFSEQIKVLSQVGLKPAEIAEITGKTANNVRVMQNYLKKKGGKKNG